MKSSIRKFLVLTSIILAFVLIFSFVGCNKEKDLQTEFAEYISLSKKNGNYLMSSETEVSLFAFEKTDDALPKFCIDFNIEYKSLYNWLNLPSETRKADLKAVGVLARNFITSKDWSNNCQIYVSVIYNPGTETIYDLNKDTLYVPNCDSLFIKMYDTYSTCSLSTIRDMPSGPDWLAYNNIESYSDLESMWVYIINGTLKISGESKSTAV